MSTDLKIKLTKKAWDNLLWNFVNVDSSHYLRSNARKVGYYKQVEIPFTQRGLIRDVINSCTQTLNLEGSGRWRGVIERVRSECKEHLYEDPESLVFNYLKDDKREQLQRLCLKAWDFVSDEMGIDVELNDMLHYIYLSNNSRYAKMWWKPKRSKNGKNKQYYYKVRVIDRVRWYTYERKTIGLKANGIEVDLEHGYMFQLVHEFTHVGLHMKYGREGVGRETDTTRMEIKYAKEHLPEYYDKLDELVDERRNNKVG